jgi:hypothetical protein
MTLGQYSRSGTHSRRSHTVCLPAAVVPSCQPFCHTRPTSCTSALHPFIFIHFAAAHSRNAAPPAAYSRRLLLTAAAINGGHALPAGGSGLRLLVRCVRSDGRLLGGLLFSEYLSTYVEDICIHTNRSSKFQNPLSVAMGQTTPFSFSIVFRCSRHNSIPCLVPTRIPRIIPTR